MKTAGFSGISRTSKVPSTAAEVQQLAQRQTDRQTDRQIENERTNEFSCCFAVVVCFVLFY